MVLHETKVNEGASVWGFVHRWWTSEKQTNKLYHNQSSRLNQTETRFPDLRAEWLDCWNLNWGHCIVRILWVESVIYLGSTHICSAVKSLSGLGLFTGITVESNFIASIIAWRERQSCSHGVGGTQVLQRLITFIELNWSKISEIFKMFFPTREVIRNTTAYHRVL